jgi:hypothetical protein
MKRCRGNAGEASVLAEFLRLGYDVCVPFGDGHPFDLAVHIAGPVFLRVQCKVAWRSGGCLLFNSAATDHGRGPRTYRGLADAFGVYFPELGSSYLVPVRDIPGGEGRLRLEPSRNGQRRRVRLARDYELSRWPRSALARLPEVGPRQLPLAQAG